MVAYICRKDGRILEQVKIQRIVDWPTCKTVTDIKAFIRMCVYYRVWIRGFLLIAEALFRLTSKNREFLCTDAQQEVIDKLNRALTTAPALRPINYEDSVLVILSVDFSLQG